jgi:hypothetical protein
METFRAGVQYGDWKGTAAADNSDQTDIEDYLIEKGLMTKEDRLMSVSFYSGENHHGKVGPVGGRALIFDGFRSQADVSKAIANESDAIAVRSERFEMTLEEFVGMFKRFHVMLTDRTFDLTDRDFEVTNIS